MKEILKYNFFNYMSLGLDFHYRLPQKNLSSIKLYIIDFQNCKTRVGIQFNGSASLVHVSL